MKVGIYCIRDQKAAVFYEPRLFQREEVALRDFNQMVHNTGSVIAFSPSDFDLFRVGEFDTDTGIVSGDNVIQFIVNGGSLV